MSQVARQRLLFDLAVASDRESLPDAGWRLSETFASQDRLRLIVDRNLIVLVAESDSFEWEPCSPN
jgi:hypothetical protein